MIAQVIDILRNEGQSITQQIKANTTKVTGKMAKSVEYQVEATDTKATLTISARPFFRVVETGRKPTPSKKPSREMIENITDWLKALGKEQTLAWAISTSINQKGTKLWQTGGRKDVFSNVINDKALEKLEKSLLDVLADNVLAQFMSSLEQLGLKK